MTPTSDLLERLQDWIVAYEREGKTYGDFEREMVAENPELFTRLERDELTDGEMLVFNISMAIADTRSLLAEWDDDRDALIGSGRS